MTQFTLHCPLCSAELTLTARRLMVRVDAGTATSGEVLFTCLSCRQTSAAAIDVDAVAALVGAGVTYLSMSEPRDRLPGVAVGGPAAHPRRPARPARGAQLRRVVRAARHCRLLTRAVLIRRRGAAHCRATPAELGEQLPFSRRELAEVMTPFGPFAQEGELRPGHLEVVQRP